MLEIEVLFEDFFSLFLPFWGIIINILEQKMYERYWFSSPRDEGPPTIFSLPHTHTFGF